MYYPSNRILYSYDLLAFVVSWIYLLNLSNFKSEFKAQYLTKSSF